MYGFPFDSTATGDDLVALLTRAGIEHRNTFLFNSVRMPLVDFTLAALPPRGTVSVGVHVGSALMQGDDRMALPLTYLSVNIIADPDHLAKHWEEDRIAEDVGSRLLHALQGDAAHTTLLPYAALGVSVAVMELLAAGTPLEWALAHEQSQR